MLTFKDQNLGSFLAGKKKISQESLLPKDISLLVCVEIFLEDAENNQVRFKLLEKQALLMDNPILSSNDLLQKCPYLRQHLRGCHSLCISTCLLGKRHWINLTFQERHHNISHEDNEGYCDVNKYCPKDYWIGDKHLRISGAN